MHWIPRKPQNCIKKCLKPLSVFVTFWIILLYWQLNSRLHFKGLGMRNLQYAMRIAKKVILKSQRQFMYGSNFYGSDVRSQLGQPFHSGIFMMTTIFSSTYFNQRLSCLVYHNEHHLVCFVELQPILTLPFQEQTKPTLLPGFKPKVQKIRLWSFQNKNQRRVCRTMIQYREDCYEISGVAAFVV